MIITPLKDSREHRRNTRRGSRRPIEGTRRDLASEHFEQLQRKKEILRDLDKKIAACITEEGELETEIYEAEEQETSLLDKIAKIKFFLRPRRSPTGTSAEPPSNPSLRLERPADHPADHEPTNSIPPTSDREYRHAGECKLREPKSTYHFGGITWLHTTNP